MKIIKGKKADSGIILQKLMFYGAELFLIALIILSTIYLINNTTKNNEAKLIAQDLSALIKTSSSYPYVSYVSYSANISDGSISIQEDRIRVSTKRGISTAPLKLIKDMQIEEKFFVNPQGIPIITLRNQILFSGEELNEMICEQLRKYNYNKEFKIIYEHKNREEQQKLEQLKQGMMLIYGQNTDLKINKIIITETETENTQKIKISFNEENETKIIYNPVHEEQETFICYIKNTLAELIKEEYSSLIIETEEIDTIQIQLPSNQHINNFLIKTEHEETRKNLNIRSQTDIMQKYAIYIYETLERITQSN